MKELRDDVRPRDILVNPLTINPLGSVDQPISVSGSVTKAMSDLMAQIIDTTTNTVYQSIPAGLANLAAQDKYDFSFPTVPDGVLLLLLVAGTTSDTPPQSESNTLPPFTAAAPAPPAKS